MIPLPQEKKETYATGYRPSDLDKAKFAKADQVKRAPGFRIPLLPPDAAPTVKLDSWKGKAVKLDQFYFKNEKPARNTEAFVACDEKQLYIGFRNYGESPEALALPREARDSFSAFGRDGLELFFNVSNEKDQYYHFVANSNGLQTDLFRDDAQWDSVWKSEAAVNSAAGSVDYLITIPFSSFAGPALNSRWLVNLCRNDVHDKSKKEYQCLFRNHVLGYRQHRSLALRAGTAANFESRFLHRLRGAELARGAALPLCRGGLLVLLAAFLAAGDVCGILLFGRLLRAALRLFLLFAVIRGDPVEDRKLDRPIRLGAHARLVFLLFSSLLFFLFQTFTPQSRSAGIF